MNENKILSISELVKWVGVLDYNIKTFDVVMETENGTTYNSYFINAEKKAIVETAKETFSDIYLDKIKQVTNPSEIEYIILNHTEPDHSGSLKKLLELAPKAKVVASMQAIRYLQDIHDYKFEYIIVKDSDTLDLGNRTLKFISAPNLHWPDSIYTYLVEDEILFTCDSFGAHFCKNEMFDDLVGDYYDSFKYYFDVILKPFSKFIVKAIEKIQDLNIKVIAPGHGPILRTTHKQVIAKTLELANEYIESNLHQNKRVLITYVSAYGYTKTMAESLKQGIEKEGVDVKLLDIEHVQLGELDNEVLMSDAILIGSPTINQNILLPIYKMFAIINPIRDKGKLASAFGSYGWSGEGVNIITDNLKNLKLSVCEPVSMKFRPDTSQVNQLIDYGIEFAKKIN